MKTIKKNKKIQRSKDAEAENLVKNKGWKYCPKSEWRKVRDKNDVLSDVPEIKKSKKKKKTQDFGKHKLVHIKTRSQGKK
jgi:hypothetical protein